MYAETDRLILREPVLGDTAGALGFLSDPEVMRWTHLGPDPYDEAQARRWIEDVIFHNRFVPRSSHNMVIVERQTGQIVGWIGIGNPDVPEIGNLDFGYALRRDRWGRGYMTEALVALLDFAFTEMRATIIFGECEAVNAGSYRVMEKAGMKPDCHYPEARKGLAEPRDMLRYTLSREQWMAYKVNPIVHQGVG